MANQFHSRLKGSELHRPERTGSGDPNTITLTDVRDGQYYQDLNTGSLYRYNESRDNWDLLIEYDADNEIILNSLSQASVTSGGGLTKIGQITSAVGTEEDGKGLVELDRIYADLFVGINGGSEIILQDENNPLQTLSLTVIDDVNAGEEQTIDVQGDKTDNNFPVGSILFADAKQQEALFSVDPSKVLLQLQNTDGNLASLAIDVDEIGSEIVLKTDAQGNIAQFRLDSDQVESSISLNADQIDVQGKTTFRSALVDEGIETQSGAQSKASEARVLAINTSLEALATDLGYESFQNMRISAEQGETIIDGGSLRTSLIQVDNLLAENVFSKDVVITGQLTMSSQAFIQSDDFQSGVLGFKIDSLGNAEFQDVIIGGNDSVIGNNARLENLNITDTLTVQPGGSIQGSFYSFDDEGGTIAGWIIGEDRLRSSSGNRRIELNEEFNRVSIFGSDGSEDAVMGYLEGLPRNDSNGDWGSDDYGFWAKDGDYLQIDGDLEYESGDWIIRNDASVKILNSNDNEIIRLGTDAGKKGLFLFDNVGNTLGEFESEGFFIGDNNSFVDFDLNSNTLNVKGGIRADSGAIDGPSDVTTLFDVNGSIAKYGDVNLNGVITLEDAQILLRAVIGRVNLSSYQQYIADVTENGTVSAFDASKILRHVGNAGNDANAGEDAIDTNNPFYTDCKLEFNTGESFMRGTGQDRLGFTEEFFRIAPFNSFINLLRTDFLSSEYLYAETVRPNAIVGAPDLTLDTSFSEYVSGPIVDKVGRTDVFGAIKIDNENNSEGNAATSIEPFGLDVIGDTRLQGELRFDGTTHASASSGSNGDVPNQVVGYIQINVGGTDYKVPYYA